MRVVFDSNVLISGLLFPGRQAENALLRITAGRDQLLLSKDIIDEVIGVLARKFAREAEELARAALLLADLGELIRPKRRLKVLRDDPDNRILECAVMGQADAIVTGDRAMLAMNIFKGIRLMSLRDYLDS